MQEEQNVVAGNKVFTLSKLVAKTLSFLLSIRRGGRSGKHKAM